MVILCVMLLCLLVGVFGVQLRAPLDGLRSRIDEQRHCSLPASKVTLFRSGATSRFNLDELLKRQLQKIDMSGDTDVIVMTSIGSKFLDKKKKLAMPRNSTVIELKVELSTKFPGSPPTSFQRLFYGERLLNNSETIGSLSSISPVVLTLDMITGTSSYNRTLSVTQAIEAYVATMVHQAYLGAKMQELHNPEFEPSAKAIAGYYTKLFASINESIHEQYADDIQRALAQEREPEVSSADTQAWRGKGDAGLEGLAVSPLSAAIAKEFDLNWRGLRYFSYYSIVLAIFAYLGAATPSSTRTLLLLIPALWLSKLRQLRILSKMALYLVLPLMYSAEFLRPLLPAPLQVLGEQLIREHEERVDGDGMEDDTRLKEPVSSTWRKAAKKSKKYGTKMTKRLLKKVIHRNVEGTPAAASSVKTPAGSGPEVLKKKLKRRISPVTGGSFDPIAELQRLVEGMEGLGDGGDSQLEGRQDFDKGRDTDLA